jgi:cytochrome P450
LETLGDDQSTTAINHETINEMHYLEATMMETMRMRPAVTEHDRICTNACQVNGIKIPKGTKIRMPNYPAHIDEEFFPQPFEFRPERFLKENEDEIIPYTWRAFGAGNRVCIGQRFAITEIKIFMGKLLNKYRIVATPDTKIQYFNGDTFFFMYPEIVVKLEARN